MDFNKMMDETVNLFRQKDAKKQTIWKGNTHLESTYVSLTYHFSNVAYGSQLIKTDINSQTQSKDDLLSDYLKTLRDFLLIGGITNWRDVLDVVDEDVDKIKKMDKDDDLYSVYLACLNMLLKSYYEKSKTAFKHAWVLFLKFGLVDLKIDAKDLENDFHKMVKNDLKQLTDQS